MQRQYNIIKSRNMLKKIETDWISIFLTSSKIRACFKSRESCNVGPTTELPKLTIPRQDLQMCICIARFVYSECVRTSFVFSLTSWQMEFLIALCILLALGLMQAKYQLTCLGQIVLFNQKMAWGCSENKKSWLHKGKELLLPFALRIKWVLLCSAPVFAPLTGNCPGNEKYVFCKLSIGFPFCFQKEDSDGQLQAFSSYTVLLQKLYVFHPVAELTLAF